MLKRLFLLLKVVSATLLLVYFLHLKESTCETKRNVFYFISKALFILEKIKFRILDIQISWHHQMPKLKTRNRFDWITWEVNTICKWNLASLYHITKKKKKIYKICDWKTSPRPFCVCMELGITSIGKRCFSSKLFTRDM